MYKSISYFKGLNALRFFAAFFVVMHHAESIRRKNDIGNLEWLSLFRNGGNAVVFFFVLSGFLITYLLLKEELKTKTIDVKHFYFKRMLRIWPLYFLFFFIGTLLLPHLFQILNVNYEMPYTFSQTWYYFVFFLPGLVTFFYGHHFLEPLWSIGVEEVFYLIWAPVFKFFRQNTLFVLFTVTGTGIFFKLISLTLIHNDLFSCIVNMFKFEDMAIGGLGAYFIFNRKTSLSDLFVYRKSVQCIIYSFLAVYLLLHANISNSVWTAFFKIPLIPSILLDLLYIYLIVGVSLVENNLIKIGNKYLSYLGEISYGIYMYHIIVIYAAILMLKTSLPRLNLVTGSVLFYLVLTVGVIGVSAVSKIFFENKFLTLKNTYPDKSA